MGFWTAMVIIIAIGTISAMYSVRFNKGSKQAESLF